MTTPAQPAGHENARWMLRFLSWIVAGCCLLIAVFSALTAKYFFGETRFLKTELQQVAREKMDLRREMIGEKAALLRELDDLMGAYKEVDGLISGLIGAKAPPESTAQFTDEIARIRTLVRGRPLTDAEKGEILATLASLLAGRNDGSANPGASAVLHALADRGMIDRDQIPAMLAVLRGEARPAARTPPDRGPPAENNPDGVQIEPARPQATAPVAVGPDPEAARQPPQPAPPAPLPSPPKTAPQPAGQVFTQARGRFEMAFPADWTVRDKELPGGIMALSPKFTDFPTERAYAVANASDLLHGQLLQEFASEQSDLLLRTLTDPKRISSGEMLLSGRPARFFFISHNQNGRPFLTMHIFATTPSRGYLLSFSARQDLYARMQKTFNDIAITFRIQEDPAPGPDAANPKSP